MNTPKFSIIMPCYNSEDYVCSAIKSIMNQSYQNWELVIVNDGSYDKTLNIINDYAQKDDRIKVFSKENGGYATAVNYGLNNIRGDYFLFLGSDDRLSEDLFEKIVEQIDTLDTFPDMIAFRTRLVVDGVVGEIEKLTKFSAVAYNECKIKEFIEKDRVNSAIFSIRDTSRCYSRKILGDTRYFGKTGMDADGIFSMLICHKAHSFLNVPVDGYFWTLRSNSVSASSSINKLIDRISNWHEFFEIISKYYANDITETEKQYLGITSNYIVNLCKNPKNAMKHRKFVKNEAKFINGIARYFNAKVNHNLSFIAKSPVVFSIIQWVKKRCWRPLVHIVTGDLKKTRNSGK